MDTSIDAPFWKDLKDSLNPAAYGDLRSRKLRHGIEYLSLLLLFSFILMLVIALPKLITLPSTIDEALETFTQLDIKVNATMSTPLALPANRPLVYLDLTEQPEQHNAAFVVNASTVQYQFLFIKPAFSTSELGKPLENKGLAKSFLIILIIVLLPLLLAALLVYCFLKFITLIVLLAGISYMFLGFSSKKNFGGLFKTALFAATPMVIIDTLNIGWRMQLYFIPQIIFVIYFILAITISKEGWQ